MKPLTIEDRVGLNKFDVDEEIPHIVVDEKICADCKDHICLYVCPAELFKLQEGKIHFNYKDCLECGSCRIGCDKKAIKWDYPRGGFGISYEYG